MIIKDKNTILEFLRGRSKDHKGRAYNNILECNDETMEQCHDQVQWMFPLHEESNFAKTYPIITQEVVDEAKNDETIRFNLKKAKDRMERFYGIGKYEDVDKQRKWCKEGDHNLLRITRIIRCLRLFGLCLSAQEFYRHAKEASEKFLEDDSMTFVYWNKALNADVWESLK